MTVIVFNIPTFDGIYSYVNISYFILNNLYEDINIRIWSFNKIQRRFVNFTFKTRKIIVLPFVPKEYVIGKVRDFSTIVGKKCYKYS